MGVYVFENIILFKYVVRIVVFRSNLMIEIGIVDNWNWVFLDIKFCYI